jgi:hypothetical protein
MGSFDFATISLCEMVATLRMTRLRKAKTKNGEPKLPSEKTEAMFHLNRDRRE